VKDADEDGASIMGLVINFFKTQFPSLLSIPGFFCEFISPMIKVIWKNANSVTGIESIMNNTDESVNSAIIDGESSKASAQSAIMATPTPKPKKRTSKQSKEPKHLTVPFYNEVEYKHYMERNKEYILKYKPTIKFIKGLAGHNKEEQAEYFEHYVDNCIVIKFEDAYTDKLSLAFDTNQANARKEWLRTLTDDKYLPRRKGESISIIDFLDADFLMFSYKNCVRSIPSMVDGLKPSQRKIIYTLFCRGDRAYTPEKVFQLGGKVAEKAKYHHGDQSMNGTIIGMAQDYDTSGNNIPLLFPDGNFGSRLENGEDAGAPRYIGCCLSKVARLVFPREDDSLLELTVEDDEKVEPKYYVPIVPFVLFNTTLGIGTGWSTYIPPFNPLQIITYVKDIITAIQNDEEPTLTESLEPFFRGFSGTYTPISGGYLFTGKVELVADPKYGDTWVVTELPIGYSKSQFETRLKFLMEVNERNITGDMMKTYLSKSKSDDAEHDITQAGGAKAGGAKAGGAKKVKSADPITDALQRAKASKVNWYPLCPVINYKNECTFDKIRYIIYFKDSVNAQTVITTLKLTESIKLTNMVMFDAEGKIGRFNKISYIIAEWFNVRQDLYEIRKAAQLKAIDQELLDLSNKARFIKENIEGIIDVKNIPKQQIIDTLNERGYDKVDGEYDYLLSMKIYSLTKEKYNELCLKLETKTRERDTLINTTIYEMWLRELDELETYIQNNYQHNEQHVRV
jgi:DNA topoisomerase-2